MREHRLQLLFDTLVAKAQGTSAIARHQRVRLAKIVRFARTHSPYYREHYQHLPQQVDDPTLLPVTSKQQLMARFNDSSTDRAVTIEQARAFADNPSLVGEPFLGNYTLATTSGTTGTRGIFLLDRHNLAVTNMLAIRMMQSWLTAGDVARIAIRGGRMSMVMASGGHFASAVAAARLRKGSQRRARAIQVASVHTPMPELVHQLNQFRPAILAPYASTAALLASEQEAGRLHINPVLIAVAAEGLPASEYNRIASVFKARVGNSYAATECPFLSYSCTHGWLHVNSDWVVLEAVDANYQPTPPGQPSHTVLLSNLANRVQPILRYDLGDSILQRPDPCPCGNPFPAIRVQGRAADVLTFVTARGAQVVIAPLAFGLLADQTPGIERFQIVQTSPAALRVRLLPTPDTNVDELWQTIHGSIRHLLHKHELETITIERADEPPEQTSGGKYRTVIPLR